MLRRIISAYAFWRARRLTRLAERERDLVRRMTLRNRAMIWSNRELFLLGLLSPEVYTASTNALRAAIKRRKARRSVISMARP